MTQLWTTATFVLGLIAAILGGMLCVIISRSAKAPVVLAVVILVLGLAMAIPTLSPPAEPVAEIREGEVGPMEAMSIAQAPTWIPWANPFLGAIGVLIGRRLKRV